MTNPRTLTKSRFKLGLECPAKLFYTNKRNEYADRSYDDPFLAELANGGFQVGELAKLYYPEGEEVKPLGYRDSLDETARLLEEGVGTIFEAAVAHENLFIRVDVFRKRGDEIDVIEVKSKSADGGSPEQFLTKNGDAVLGGWASYLYDVAFQKFVVQKAFPDCKVNAFLMLVDKTASCPTTGLNQKFRVKTDERGRKYAEVAGKVTDEDLSEKLMTVIGVDDICEMLYASPLPEDESGAGFEAYVRRLAEAYAEDRKIASEVGTKCKKCQFKADAAEKAEGMKSGFEECWREQMGWTDEDFASPNVLNIWNFRRAGELIGEGRAAMSELTEEDIRPAPHNRPGLSASERQWVQVSKAADGDGDAFIDRDGLRERFAEWTYPLHFIDFETSQAAIPFIKGHRPYEPIAFQFSHHVVEEDGSVRHEGQFLNTEPGVFPNYEFVRALKRELEKDDGTIFRYAAHENTYLVHIWKQLMSGRDEVEDRDELASFIESITVSGPGAPKPWEGERGMVDMLELVKAHYYHPETNGSNSIKAVLPALMNSSEYLRERYSKPVYRAEIPSLNFDPMAWYVEENGRAKDPYKMLPKIVPEITDHDLTVLEADEKLADGGAAMAAYAKLQYEDVSDEERRLVEAALLRYCELDTLAMVMIYEAWREML